jgi:hypothetical protein
VKRWKFSLLNHRQNDAHDHNVHEKVGVNFVFFVKKFAAFVHRDYTLHRLLIT